jgi:hypothetical protein
VSERRCWLSAQLSEPVSEALSAAAGHNLRSRSAEAALRLERSLRGDGWLPAQSTPNRPEPEPLAPELQREGWSVRHG